MTSPRFTCAVITAAFALALACTATAGGPTQPAPNISGPQMETQMPSQIDKNAEQSVEDKRRADEAAAKAKADAAKNTDGSAAR
jgi:hypothetical protein